LNSIQEIDDKIKELKEPFILIVKGKIFKTNVNISENTQIWNRLVGYAYCKKILDKAKDPTGHGSYFCYLVNGKP